MTEALPSRDTDFRTLSQGAPIMVLAPHPDDESLGCGALLAHAFSAGTGARIVCLTDGSASHRGSRRYPPARLASLRRCELADAIRCLGGDLSDILWLGEPDGQSERSDRKASVIRLLIRLSARLGARSIFAPLASDPHSDHRAAAAIAAEVAAGAGLAHYGYPIWTRWQRPYFRALLDEQSERRLPLGPHAARKRAAIAAHRSQHGQVVDDASEAFCLDPGFVADLSTGPELFYELRK